MKFRQANSTPPASSQVDAAQLPQDRDGILHRRGQRPCQCRGRGLRRWWSAGSDQPGEWLCVDLGRDCDVRAVQVNMADEALAVDFPADSYGDDRKTRHIETRPQISHYTVETSLDGNVWTARGCRPPNAPTAIMSTPTASVRGISA